MEGRDIGTVVFPDADREVLPRRRRAAERGHGAGAQLRERGETATLPRFGADIEARDRATARARIPRCAGAGRRSVIDTTGARIGGRGRGWLGRCQRGCLGRWTKALNPCKSRSSEGG